MQRNLHVADLVRELRPSDEHVHVYISGHSGSGKSTLSELFQERRNATEVSWPADLAYWVDKDLNRIDVKPWPEGFAEIVAMQNRGEVVRFKVDELKLRRIREENTGREWYQFSGPEILPPAYDLRIFLYVSDKEKLEKRLIKRGAWGVRKEDRDQIVEKAVAAADKAREDGFWVIDNSKYPTQEVFAEEVFKMITKRVEELKAQKRKQVE